MFHEMGTGWLLVLGGKEQLVLRWEGEVFTIQMPKKLERNTTNI